MKNKLRIAALIALALAASSAEAAKFYKWKDAQGATQYTVDPPPAGAQASEVRIKTDSVTDAEEPAPAAKPKPAAAAKPKTEEKAKAPEQKPEPAATTGQYAERCKGLRANLKTLEESVRVREKTDSGEERQLSEEEKAARLDETRRAIKAFCE